MGKHVSRQLVTDLRPHPEIQAAHAITHRDMLIVVPDTDATEAETRRTVQDALDKYTLEADIEMDSTSAVLQIVLR